MRAAVFKEVGVLSIEDRPRPRLVSDDDVLVRVVACGVCGTDVHILSDPPGHPATLGIILGHEFVGDVVEVGAAVHTVTAGDRVAIRPILTCGTCRHCLAGFPNHCADLEALGVHRNGGLAQHAVAPQSACIPLARSVPPSVAAMTEPLACVVNAVERAGPVPGEDVVIIGAGAIGLLFLAVLRTSGVRRIVVVEPIAVRREVAQQMGANAVIDPTSTDSVGSIQQHLPDGPSLVIDAVGSQLATAVAIAARRGRVILFGMDARARPEVAQFAITERELSILGSFVGQHSFPAAIRLLESGGLDLSPIVSHVVALDEVADVIGQIRRGAVVKAVVMMDAGTA